MKKLLLVMTAALALSLVGCNGSNDYKAKGQELSKELNEKVTQNDTAAVLDADETIRKVEADLIASGDTAALATFRVAMKDARARNAAFVTLAKIHNGVDKKEAIQELIQDALNEDVDIHAITSSIDAILKSEEKNKK